ncbi:DUF4240 domain-containing protein [Thiocystis violacea]|uniref:DUF4240 domain-containing protein n=1 Tax=Thiocystis violacea TaxID=13725 RepID=UPI001907228E|nr:DUF4240 domain-containing protein [Thiocystis violacea]MBK1719577.1 hypothetical protein [Thiocystis violacea]
MDTIAFWKLIDESRQASEGDPERQLEELGALLDALSAQEIVEFENMFDAHFQSSYTWPLWGAAYVIGGGCSDDGFDYFRCWLISRGEKTFHAALTRPDELAFLIDESDEEVDCQVEGWQSVGIDAWCRKTGLEYSAFPSSPSGAQSDGPLGDEWSEEDLDRLYPKLTKRFG